MRPPMSSSWQQMDVYQVQAVTLAVYIFQYGSTASYSLRDTFLKSKLSLICTIPFDKIVINSIAVKNSAKEVNVCSIYVLR